LCLSPTYIERWTIIPAHGPADSGHRKLWLSTGRRRQALHDSPAEHAASRFTRAIRWHERRQQQLLGGPSGLGGFGVAPPPKLRAYDPRAVDLSSKRRRFDRHGGRTGIRHRMMQSLSPQALSMAKGNSTVDAVIGLARLLSVQWLRAWQRSYSRESRSITLELVDGPDCEGDHSQSDIAPGQHGCEGLIKGAPERPEQDVEQHSKSVGQQPRRQTQQLA